MLPHIVPSTPLATWLLKFVVIGRDNSFSSASCLNAFATGCPLPCCNDAAIVNNLKLQGLWGKFLGTLYCLWID